MEKSGNTVAGIIERSIQGDAKAQFLLYKQYSKAMYNICMRLLNNKMDAEDVLQESFVKAFGHLDELDNKGSFGSWLKRIVINKCISHHRKNRLHFEDITDDLLEKLPEQEEIPWDINPSIIHSAVKDLPAGGRIVLTLRALEGYKHREIAEMLNISVSNSKTQYYRALTLLNMKLKHKIYAE